MEPNLKYEEPYGEENMIIEEEDVKGPTIAAPWEHEYILRNIIFYIYCHTAGVYGAYLCFTSAKWETMIFTIIFHVIATFGITAGAHRLWAHKSYKATKPLQIILMVSHSLAYQRTLVTWIRDHRLHHKYSDTDADPHNASRGLFFSHIGWLLVKNHPEVMKRKKLVDMSDVYSNPVLMFQKRHASWLLFLVAIVIPTAIPCILGETFSNSWHVGIMRYLLTSHSLFLVNSVAHRWGYRPYDKSIKACQSPFLVTILGEGFHNYHHAIPWDYRTAELGNNPLNFTTRFIDFFERLGWAYDLKSASDGMVKQRIKRTGDGTDLWGRKI